MKLIDMLDTRELTTLKEISLSRIDEYAQYLKIHLKNYALCPQKKREYLREAEGQLRHISLEVEKLKLLVEG